MATEATRANMAAVASQHGVIAWSPVTGEEYSADHRDYWDRPVNEPLLDSAGEPMLLVRRITQLVDVEELA